MHASATPNIFLFPYVLSQLRYFLDNGDWNWEKKWDIVDHFLSIKKQYPHIFTSVFIIGIITILVFKVIIKYITITNILPHLTSRL